MIALLLVLGGLFLFGLHMIAEGIGFYDRAPSARARRAHPTGAVRRVHRGPRPYDWETEL